MKTRVSSISHGALAAALCAAGAVGAGAASAQQADGGAQAQSGVEEIVVVAQRREQQLQDVPIAITAFNNRFIETRNVNEFTNLAAFTPNVKIVVTNRNSAPSIAMRGSVTVNPAPNFDPTVGLYIDGVYQGKQYGSVFDISDIDHIEMLRGPQGTLYGRNTLAGAVNIITAKPTGTFGGSIKAGYGNYGHWQSRASLDLPAIGPLSFKLSGVWEKRDGFVKIVPNPYPKVTLAQPVQADSYGAIDRQSARFAARLAPMDDFTVDYALEYSQAHDTLGYSQPVSYSAGGIFDPSSGSYVGGYNSGTGVYAGQPFNLYVFPNERSGVGYEGGAFQNGLIKGNPLEENTRNWQHSLIAAWKLGDVTLKSISGLRQLNHAWWNDTDGTPLPLIASAMEMHYKSFSQEVQATGGSGPIQFAAGLYYFYDNGYSYNPQQYFGGNIYVGGFGYKTRSYAAYGQVEVSPAAVPGLTVIGGLRYSSERKYTTRDWRSVNAATGALVSTLVPYGTAANAKFNGWTPTATIKYDFSPQVNVYVRYARGFKSGGFNGEATNVAEATTPFRPEYVDSFEAGLKTRFLDNRLQLNIAGFYDLHTDMQLSVFLGNGSLASGIRNAGRANIKGLEIEMQAVPFDRLRIGGNIGILDPKYKRFMDGGVNAANDRAFPYAPKFTASANVDATLAEGDFGALHLIVDYAHSDAYYLFPYSLSPTATLTAQTTRADSSDVFDGILRLSDIQVGDSKFAVSVWTKNLFNVSNRVAGVDFGSSFGHATVVNFNPPRTFGADVTVKF